MFRACRHRARSRPSSVKFRLLFDVLRRELSSEELWRRLGVGGLTATVRLNRDRTAAQRPVESLRRPFEPVRLQTLGCIQYFIETVQGAVLGSASKYYRVQRLVRDISIRFAAF